MIRRDTGSIRKQGLDMWFCSIAQRMSKESEREAIKEETHEEQDIEQEELDEEDEQEELEEGVE